ncbi:NlpC/P60 family protein [Fodinisporobacter ferrooxydans]|uniref:NlpC/P60 family protein n=1 Tax=Fodinisporobacter ferrooxydans TaxID=2901836 RepID=A0ABY4CG34_9BACL|nr:NlpC/P60 family protein [Alicyclobacillaceae bacterium MYW30-H2]
MKKFVTTLMTVGVLSVCSVFGTQAFAATNVQNVVQFPDAKPFIDQQNHTQVPIRFISQSLGYHVRWQSKGQQIQVIMNDGSKQVVLETDQPFAYVNGVQTSLDSNPVIKDNRTYVPLRFVAEAFGSNVQWNPSDQTAMITSDSKHLLVPVPAAPSAKPVDESVLKADQMIQFSEKYLGTPYVFGGTSTSGFDCSGFIQFVFSQNGMQLPRTAAQMFQLGTPVSELQPGDLVFFSTYAPGASHVGIYIGNRQFISATTSRGVSISSLDNPYWSPRYIGAKRL